MTAADRARARQLEAHRAATARNAWRCRREECPLVDVWHPAESREAAFAESAAHQRAHDGIVAAPIPPRRAAPPPPPVLGSRPTAHRPPASTSSTWDDRTEETWIDRL